MSDRNAIRLAAPDLTSCEEENVAEAIRSSWISSTGEYVDRFEKQFAELCQSKACLSVCNGTAALHLALLAMDVGPGDEVLVPALTYVASANAVRYVGAEPVFVDVSEDTWCITPDLLEDCSTAKTKGIIAVHLYGHPADMDAISAVASAHGIWVVEDAAEAHFAQYKGRPVGSLADVATFSFYGNKIITCGEGGAVTADDPEVVARMRMYRNQGMDPDRRYYHPVVGYNYRLTNVACAILCGQLERRDAIVARRREIFSSYRKRLDGVPGIAFQPVAQWADPAPWLFCITVDPSQYGSSRDELMVRLDEEGIETRPFFIPVHRMPPYQRPVGVVDGRHPITEQLSENGMNLPTHSGLTESDIGRITAAIRESRR